MSEESRTPDVVALTRRAYEQSSDGDFDGLMTLFDSGAEWDMSRFGLEVYEGSEVQVTNYPDIDEARAAAKRLAASRG
jgi:hypothetical protein